MHLFFPNIPKTCHPFPRLFRLTLQNPKCDFDWISPSREWRHNSIAHTPGAQIVSIALCTSFIPTIFMKESYLHVYTEVAIFIPSFEV